MNALRGLVFPAVFISDSFSCKPSFRMEPEGFIFRGCGSRHCGLCCVFL